MSNVVLQKVLRDAGLGSRRGVEKLITGGLVTVNGRRVARLGAKVNPATDVVKVDKGKIKRPFLVYFLLNKPAGFISAVKDEQGRKTVVDLVKTKERIFPVGRLDINTTGMIILTNDGDLAYRLTHPKFSVEKEYQAQVRIPKNWSPGFLQKHLDKLKSGVMIAGNYKTAPALARVVKKSSGADTYLITIIVHEGRKHEVRQMLSGVGLSVLSLRRVRIGKLRLSNLRAGESRKLRPEEIKLLKAY